MAWLFELCERGLVIILVIGLAFFRRVLISLERLALVALNHKLGFLKFLLQGFDSLVLHLELLRDHLEGLLIGHLGLN